MKKKNRESSDEDASVLLLAIIQACVCLCRESTVNDYARYIYIYISWWIIFIYRFLSSRLIISLRWLFQTCLISMLVILSEVLSSKARLYKKMSSNKCRSLVRYYLIDHWCVASMSILPGHDNLNTRFSLFFFRS
jgi:hypothetical protein